MTHVMKNLIGNMQKTLDDIILVCVVFINIKRALFGTVNHTLLMKKLARYGERS